MLVCTRRDKKKPLTLHSWDIVVTNMDVTLTFRGQRSRPCHSQWLWYEFVSHSQCGTHKAIVMFDLKIPESAWTIVGRKSFKAFVRQSFQKDWDSRIFTSTGMITLKRMVSSPSWYWCSGFRTKEELWVSMLWTLYATLLRGCFTRVTLNSRSW